MQIVCIMELSLQWTGLALETVMPGTMRYLHEMNKAKDSYWRFDNSKRQLSSKYTFPSLPWPIREDWNRLKGLHPFGKNHKFSEIFLENEI